MYAFERKSEKELHEMSSEEKIAYFNGLRELALSLPYDEEKEKLGEEKFLKTAHFVVPKIVEKLKPNILGKKYETLPENFMVVSNHLGSLDEFLIGVAFPDIPFHYMISKTLFKPQNLCMGYYYVNRGAIAIDRNDPEDKLRGELVTMQYLYRGRYVAIYPEGSRMVKKGSDGTVQDFKPGAVRIARACQVPIIPVAINNNFTKNGLYINVGEPFEVSYDDDANVKTLELREKEIDMWEENRKSGAKILTKNDKHRNILSRL